MICFDETTLTFYLNTERTSYIMRVFGDGILTHIYYGAKIPQDDMRYFNVFRGRNSSPSFCAEGKNVSLDMLPQEYPTYGFGDMRMPAVRARFANGRSNSDLRYVSHRILKGKPKIDGLPQLEADETAADTLEITVRDAVNGLEAVLSYSVFEKENIIARHSAIRNISGVALTLLDAAGMSMDLQVGELEMITLEGAWARERSVERYSLHHGVSSVCSRRGASGHSLNPFAALVTKGTDEDHGDVWATALVYSGDFLIAAEVEQGGIVRFKAGVNPDTFAWHLNDGEVFVTPEVLLTFSAQGLGEMSRNFHAACRNHLGRSADRDLAHPIIINNWEAMYFDLSEEKLCRFIADCKGLGIDTFVLDDGWFGHRNDDHSSLGDWFVDPVKFPQGLDGIVRCCKENNMKFGLWFEPEMVSRDSELFRAHPDWCIHAPGREPIESRNQLVLDFARPEVVDGIYGQIAAMLERYEISYIKWDMNRNISDNGSDSLPPEQQGEHAHRYILGVYRLMQRLIDRFPHVFFEGCASGGGRFDFGILYYMSQIWTSDDSDAVARLKIQYGTSLVYPPAAIVAHVSACPNHQTRRNEPFRTRGDVAQAFSFGYELNVGALTADERAQIAEQTAKHRELAPMIETGTFYRLRSPFEGDCCAWQTVSAEKDRSFAVYALQFLTPNNRNDGFLRLKGLDPDRIYRVEPLGISVSGATLMNAGLPIMPPDSDYPTLTFDLTATDV